MTGKELKEFAKLFADDEEVCNIKILTMMNPIAWILWTEEDVQRILDDNDATYTTEEVNDLSDRIQNELEDILGDCSEGNDAMQDFIERYLNERDE